MPGSPNLWRELPVEELIDRSVASGAFPEVRSLMIGTLAEYGLRVPKVLAHLENMVLAEPFGGPFARVCNELVAASKDPERSSILEPRREELGNIFAQRVSREVAVDRPATEAALVGAHALIAGLATFDPERAHADRAAQLLFNMIREALTEKYYGGVKFTAIQAIPVAGTIHGYLGDPPADLLEKMVRCCEEWSLEARSSPTSHYFRGAKLSRYDELTNIPHIVEMQMHDATLTERAERAVSGLLISGIEAHLGMERHDKSKQIDEAIALIGVLSTVRRVWHGTDLLPTTGDDFKSLSDSIKSLTASITAATFAGAGRLLRGSAFLSVVERVAERSTDKDAIVDNLVRVVERRICNHSGEPIQLTAEEGDSVLGLSLVVCSAFKLDPEKGRQLAGKYLTATAALGERHRFRVESLLHPPDSSSGASS